MKGHEGSRQCGQELVVACRRQELDAVPADLLARSLLHRPTERHGQELATETDAEHRPARACRLDEQPQLVAQVRVAVRLVDPHASAKDDEPVFQEGGRDPVAGKGSYDAQLARSERLAQRARAFERFVLDDEDGFHARYVAAALGGLQLESPRRSP